MMTTSTTTEHLCQSCSHWGGYGCKLLLNKYMKMSCEHYNRKEKA